MFRIRDFADEGRWPFYNGRAWEQGARSLVSLPLATEGKTVSGGVRAGQ